MTMDPIQPKKRGRKYNLRSRKQNQKRIVSDDGSSSSEEENEVIPVTDANIDEDVKGSLVFPATYCAQIFKQIEGYFMPISEKVTFKVKPLLEENLDSNLYLKMASYRDKVSLLRNKAYDLSNNINDTEKLINRLLKSYERANNNDKQLHSRLLSARINVLTLQQKMNGSKSRKEVGEENEYPTIWTYLWAANGSSRSTYGPTDSHKEYLNYAEKIFVELDADYKNLEKTISLLIEEMKEVKAPLIQN